MEAEQFFKILLSAFSHLSCIPNISSVLFLIPFPLLEASSLVHFNPYLKLFFLIHQMALHFFKLLLNLTLPCSLALYFVQLSFLFYIFHSNLSYIPFFPNSHPRPPPPHTLFYYLHNSTHFHSVQISSSLVESFHWFCWGMNPSSNVFDTFHPKQKEVGKTSYGMELRISKIAENRREWNQFSYSRRNPQKKERVKKWSRSRQWGESRKMHR